ncbi:bactofilin family protein [Cupriavidus agavae]|uniref:Cytoskeletal protein CcmA (Bactofilin family) n=1 Tax=Cupriavidus agavae TaxID=1001822 RepID=A0A4Q7S9U0_9BURK|nr:polymer-forming cytoskeletal protein [Cupriavidus agavae]RZT43123.1 cytoskeletal protein CcmA (bactofilin family) [Cupriavidus agavae]
MLFSKKKGLNIDTLIGQDTVIEGDVAFSGGLRLDGRVRGNVTAIEGKSSMLVISEKGAVEGEVRVEHLVLNGTVTGPVHAAELLELQAHARVYGEVRYAALEMQQGALVEGRLIPLVQAEVRALTHQAVPSEPEAAQAQEAEPAQTVDVAAEAVTDVSDVSEVTEEEPLREKSAA